MNRRIKKIDIKQLERQAPDELLRMAAGLKADLPQNQQEAMLWTKEFAASGKEGKPQANS